MSSCSTEKNQTFTSKYSSSILSTSQDIQIWINNDQKNIKLIRLRKAEGASRARLLVELKDSSYLSMFITPFVNGNSLINSSIAESDDIKFSRTHLEFKKQISSNQYLFYDVDTLLNTNQVIINKIDTINQSVSGYFQCQLKILKPGNNPANNDLKIYGTFLTTYKD